MKRALGIALVIAVTAGTLTYSFWNADLEALWRLLRFGRHWVVVPFLFVLAIFFFSNAQRWSLMLRPFGRYSSREVLPSMMIGFASNNVLPLRLGELIRVYLFSKEFKQPRSGVLMTVVLERALDLIGILLSFGIGIAMLPEATPALRTTGLIGAMLVAGICLVLLAFLAFEKHLSRWWLKAGRILPQRIRKRGESYLDEFSRGLISLRDPSVAVLLLVQSFGRWLLAALLAWLSIYAYGEAVTFPLAMVVLGVTAFAVSMPSVPGFVGPIQAAFVFVLTPFGLAHETALAGSIFFLLGHWIPVTSVGVIMLMSKHFSFSQLRRAVEESEPETPRAEQ